jgi:hypothetical protein
MLRKSPSRLKQKSHDVKEKLIRAEAKARDIKKKPIETEANGP